MTAQFSKSNLAYELPRQTYINVRLEEPNLFTDTVSPDKPSLLYRLAARIAAFATRARHSADRAELHAMTDRELDDIGLTRGDIGRAFSTNYARDLREARALLG